jgi:hypothetical protein
MLRFHGPPSREGELSVLRRGRSVLRRRRNVACADYLSPAATDSANVLPPPPVSGTQVVSGPARGAPPASGTPG